MGFAPLPSSRARQTETQGMLIDLTSARFHSGGTHRYTRDREKSGTLCLRVDAETYFLAKNASNWP